MQRSFTRRSILVLASLLLFACGSEAEPGGPGAFAPAAGAGGTGQATLPGPVDGQPPGSELPADAECAGAGCSCQGGLAACNESLLSGGGDSVRCVDLQNDAAHCGGCGALCAVGQVCVSGACAAMCPAGLTPCGGSCVDVASDSLNCGACGRACSAGACSGGACPAGKDCAVTTQVSTPLMTDFESYAAGSP